jgi:uncharacterized membrane protein
MHGDEVLYIGCALVVLVTPLALGIAGWVVALGARKRVAALHAEVASLRQQVEDVHRYLWTVYGGAGAASARTAAAGTADATVGPAQGPAEAMVDPPAHPAAPTGTARPATDLAASEPARSTATAGPAAAPLATAPPLAPSVAAATPATASPTAGTTTPAGAPAAPPAPAPIASPPQPPAPAQAAASVPAGAVAAAAASTPGSEATTASSRATSPPSSGAPPRAIGLEERLGTRLPIWLGAAALALAGIFLVKYSIDQGWLSPAVRVALGALFGVLLLTGGELLRRRQPRIAQALSAAGIADLYAVFLAATNLYKLLPPLAGFALMALNTAVAVALALRHGQLIAILGLLGGFATPALIRTGDPNARNLMAYLILLEVGLLATARRRSWPLLSAGALLGGIAWVALFAAKALEPGDSLWLGLFLLAAIGFHAWQLRTAAAEPSDDTAAAPPSTAERLIGAVAAALAVAVFAGVVGSSGYGTSEWALFGLLALGSLVLARLLPGNFALAPIACVVSLVLLLAWSANLDPTRSGAFLATAAALGGTLTAVAWVCQRGAERPAAWASLAAANAVVTFLIAYAGARSAEGAHTRPWGVYALVLAGVAIAAAVPLVRRRAAATQAEPADATALDACLGAAAVAATSFVSLAVPLFLDRAWLTVALGLEVTALVWIAGRLRLALLLRLAGLIGAVVAVRLLANPAILSYPTGTRPLVNWLLYGYGIPLLAFAVALRQAAELAGWTGGWARPAAAGEQDASRAGAPGEAAPRPAAGETAMAGLAASLAAALRWGCLAIGTALVSLEVRHFMGGGRLAGTSSNLFLEAGILAILWLAGGLAVHRLGRRHPAAAWTVGGELLAWGGLAIAGLGCGLVANPLWTPHPVGTTPVLNLLLAVGLPLIVALGAWAHTLQTATPPAGRAQVFALAALVAGLALVTLEVRQAFQGARLDLGVASNAEHLSYSGAWILAGLGLLVAGIRLAARRARQAGLAVMLLAVLKVFLYDLSELDDLYRVVSFLGLGASLLLLAFLYQHFVFRHRDEP